METEQLIRTLAADNPHRAHPVGFVLALGLLAAAPFSLAVFLMTLGVRPDVMTAMHNPFFDLKFLVTLALAISAIAVGLHLSRPEASLKGWGWLLLVPAGIIATGIAGEMMMPQRLPMMTRLVGTNSRVCVTAIPLLSLPLLAGALIGLRHGAPARHALAGAQAHQEPLQRDFARAQGLDATAVRDGRRPAGASRTSAAELAELPLGFIAKP